MDPWAWSDSYLEISTTDARVEWGRACIWAPTTPPHAWMLPGPPVAASWELETAGTSSVNATVGGAPVDAWIWLPSGVGAIGLQATEAQS